VAFFALGALLLLLRLSLPEPAASLVVEVPRGAKAAEVQQAVHDAVLVDQGLRAGWIQTDPLLRRRLVDNMRFAGLAEGEDAALLDLALRLGMHRTDPVVRSRLLERATRLLDVPPQPTDAELSAYLERHADRYAQPARYRFEQVFFTELQAGRAALPILAAGGEVAGDALIALPRTTSADLDTLERRVGTRWALGELPHGEWSGPLPSAYGAHLVRVLEVEPARLPPLHEVRTRVAEEWRHDAAEEQRSARIAELMRHYRITLEQPG
jgi:hypothetical protein